MKVQVNVCRSGERPQKVRERVEVTVVKRSAVHSRMSERPAAALLIPEPVHYAPLPAAAEQESYALHEEDAVYASPYSTPADRSDEFDSFFSDVTTSAERSAHTAGFEPQVSDAIEQLTEMIEAEEEKVRLLTQAISAEEAAADSECVQPIEDYGESEILSVSSVAEESIADSIDNIAPNQPELDFEAPFYQTDDTKEAEREEEQASELSEESDAKEDAAESHSDESMSVRFFDRGENGQLVEVDRSVATGREVRTYNGDRLTRICGVIRRNGSDVQPHTAMVPSENDSAGNTPTDETEE